MQLINKIRFIALIILCSLAQTLNAGTKSYPKLPKLVSDLQIYSGNENQEINDILKLPSQKFKEYSDGQLFSGKVYWLKITIDNNSVSENKYILHFNSSISNLNIYQQDSSGIWTEMRTGIFIAEKDRPLKGFIKDKVPVAISNGKYTTFYIRLIDFWGKGPDISEMSFIPATQFNKWLSKNYRYQFFLSGIIAILCLFNLILFLFTHEKIYLLYAAYVATGGLYFITFFQILEAGFFSNHPLLYYYLYFFITISQFIYYWFLFHALKNNGVEKERFFIRKYAFLITIVAGIIIFVSVFNIYLAINLSYIYSITNGLTVALIFFLLFKKVLPSVKIILAGSLFVVIGGITGLTINLFKISISHVFLHETGFFIELIFFSVAINFMHNTERMEKLKAQLNNSILEAKQLKKEKEARLLREEISLKNRDLATKVVMISQKESLIKHIAARLKNEMNNNIQLKSGIRTVIKELESTVYNKYWNEFETHFVKVHPNFYKNLNDRYSNLTSSERKLCAFIKLNLSTKEISNITQKSPESIHTSRCRLRRKMDLDQSENLEKIINAIN